VKSINEMSQLELAAYIQSYLRAAGIDVVLSGGSAVSFYSNDKYVSKDLDLINVRFATRKEIRLVMERLGFQEKGRYFIHADTEFLVEFPKGPLSVGEEPVKEIREFELPTGILRIVSPTDCVKDRLCAYYFWNDQQGLAQAVLVAESQNVDVKEIKRWSKVQRKTDEFDAFKEKLG
jgi:hypothetical protein